MSKKWKNKLMDNSEVKYTDLGSELEAYISTNKKGEIEMKSTSPVPEEPEQETIEEMTTPMPQVVEPVQEDNKTFKNEPTLNELEKKAELLTQEEKELLQHINAFSGYHLLWVLKRNAETIDGMELLRLRLSSTDKTKQYSVSLPMFTTDTKFKGLESGKMYMLSELGI